MSAQSWLLGGGYPWRTLDPRRDPVGPEGAVVANDRDGLTLAPLPQGDWGLEAADGSLGRLTLPRGVAVWGDVVLTLSSAGDRVLRYDPVRVASTPLAEVGLDGLTPPVPPGAHREPRRFRRRRQHRALPVVAVRRRSRSPSRAGLRPRDAGAAPDSRRRRRSRGRGGWRRRRLLAGPRARSRLQGSPGAGLAAAGRPGAVSRRSMGPHRRRYVRTSLPARCAVAPVWAGRVRSPASSCGRQAAGPGAAPGAGARPFRDTRGAIRRARPPGGQRPPARSVRPAPAAGRRRTLVVARRHALRPRPRGARRPRAPEGRTDPPPLRSLRRRGSGRARRRSRRLAARRCRGARRPDAGARRPAPAGARASPGRGRAAPAVVRAPPPTRGAGPASPPTARGACCCGTADRWSIAPIRAGVSSAS